MIGYMLSWDGVTLNSGFGHNRVSLSRSVEPTRARILGGASYDLDGMYTYPSGQTYTATFADRNGNANTRAMFQRLGSYGWLKANSRAGVTLINWAKLVSIDNGYEVQDWITSDVNKYTLTFACSPFWYEDSDTTVTLNAATTWGLTNAGNARSTWWTLYVTSAIGSALTVTISRRSGSTYGVPKYGEAIYDATGKQSFIYNASKAAGTMLVIDGRTNSVTLNGNDDYGDITLPDTQIDLGYLYPGVTQFTFSTGVTGSIIYRGAYI